MYDEIFVSHMTIMEAVSLFTNSKILATGARSGSNVCKWLSNK